MPKNKKQKLSTSDSFCLIASHILMIKCTCKLSYRDPLKMKQRNKFIRITNKSALHTGTKTIWHTYAYCTAGLDLTQCPGALSHSTALSLDSDRSRVEVKWSSDSDP